MRPIVRRTDICVFMSPDRPGLNNFINMKSLFFGLFALGLGLSSLAQETKQDLLKKKVLLPNGWTLTPAGTSLPLGDNC